MKFIKDAPRFALMTTLAVSLISCTPKPMSSEQKDTTVPAVTQIESDGDQLNSLTNALQSAKSYQYQGKISTEQYLSFLNSALSLAQKSSQPELLNLSLERAQDFLGSQKTETRQLFSKGAFVEMAAAQAEALVVNEATKGVAMVQLNKQKVSRIPKRVEQQVAKPQQPMLSLEQFKLYLNQVFQRYQIEFVQAQLDEEFARPLMLEFSQQIKKVNAALNQAVFQINTANDVQKAVSGVYLLAQEFNQQLDQESVTSLNLALSLDQKLQAVQSEEDMLRFLVELWEVLNTEQREKVFKANSQEFYDLLSKKGPGGLKCLKGGSCTLARSLEKSVGVIPAIKKIGVPELKTMVREGLLKEITQALELKLAASVGLVSQAIGAQLLEAIDNQIKSIKSLSTDFSKTVFDAAQLWSIENIDTDGATAGRVIPFGLESIKMDQVSVFKSGPGDFLGSQISTRAQAQVLELRGRLLAKPTGVSILTQQRKLSIEMINQMLSLSGYDKSRGQTQSAYFTSFNNQPGLRQKFSIAKMMSSSSAFYVPDHLPSQLGLDRGEGGFELSSSVKTQAAWLKSLSHAIVYFRDFEVSQFDNSLGDVNLSDLKLHFDVSDYDQKLFPKDSLYALAVGAGSAMVLPLTKSLSNAALLTSETESPPLWSGDAGATDQQILFAALVDIKKGVRQDVVQAHDLALYLESLLDFTEAMRGLEKTSSRLLQVKNSSGQSGVKQLSQSLLQLERLTIGVANFLASKVSQQDGSVYSQFSLAKSDVVEKSELTPIQALKIAQVLTKLANLKSLPIYNMTAGSIFAKQMQSLKVTEVSSWTPDQYFAFLDSIYELNQTHKSTLATELLKKAIGDQ